MLKGAEGIFPQYLSSVVSIQLALENLFYRKSLARVLATVPVTNTIRPVYAFGAKRIIMNRQFSKRFKHLLPDSIQCSDVGSHHQHHPQMLSRVVAILFLHCLNRSCKTPGTITTCARNHFRQCDKHHLDI